jgi:hypothetical protein
MNKELYSAIKVISKLRKQGEFEQDCFIKALHSIPEKYSNILFLEYLRLLDTRDKPWIM